MSDTCHLEVTMAEKDRERFEKLANVQNIWNDSWVEDGVFTGVMYEANYSLYTELEELAAEGCEFHGTQGAGSEYGAAEFVTVDKKVYYAQVDEQGNVVAPIDLKTYLPNPGELKTIKTFVKGMEAIIDKFNALLEEDNAKI